MTKVQRRMIIWRKAVAMEQRYRNQETHMFYPKPPGFWTARAWVQRAIAWAKKNEEPEFVESLQTLWSLF